MRRPGIVLLQYLCIAIVGGGALGVACFPDHSTISDPFPAAIAGAMLGLLLLPLTGGALLDRPLVPAVTLMYGPALAAAVLSRLYLGPGAAVLPTLVTFVIMCGVIVFALPSRRRPSHCCQQCGYDLRGAHHERCPECGTSCFPVESVDLVDPSE